MPCAPPTSSPSRLSPSRGWAAATAGAARAPGGRQRPREPVERPESVVRGWRLLRFGAADRAAQRLGLRHSPAMRDPIEHSHGLDVERVRRADCCYGHTTILRSHIDPCKLPYCRRVALGEADTEWGSETVLRER